MEGKILGFFYYKLSQKKQRFFKIRIPIDENLIPLPVGMKVKIYAIKIGCNCIETEG